MASNTNSSAPRRAPASALTGAVASATTPRVVRVARRGAMPGRRLPSGNGGADGHRRAGQELADQRGGGGTTQLGGRGHGQAVPEHHFGHGLDVVRPEIVATRRHGEAT